VDARRRLSVADRARMAALLADVIAVMRVDGRDPQAHQFALGTDFAALLRALVVQGVPWAARGCFAHADRGDLGLDGPSTSAHPARRRGVGTSQQAERLERSPDRGCNRGRASRVRLPVRWG
jgi:hypothetical protein